MTLRRFLLETRSIPPVAVRFAMASVIAELDPTRLDDRRSYSAFYSAVLGRLRPIPQPPSVSAHRTNGSSIASIESIDVLQVLPITDVAEEAVTYRRLAVRVIQRAFRDITAPACAADDRESARQFLAGSPMLFHWCSVAALDPRRVMARATTLGSRPPAGL